MSQKHESGRSLKSQLPATFLRTGHGEEHGTDGLAPRCLKSGALAVPLGLPSPGGTVISLHDLLSFLPTDMKHHLIFLVSLALVVVGLATCRPKSSGPRSEQIMDRANLVDSLRAAGAKVEPAGEVSQPFFSVKGQIIKV